MIKSEIINAITAKVVSTPYNIWRIGLTHDLVERKLTWRVIERLDVTHWSDWQADSLSDAQDIETFFSKTGMEGGTGGDLSPDKTTFVYVF